MSAPSEKHACPSCNCEFLQPFVCITCGAQTLYGNTVKSQEARIDTLTRETADLRREVATLREALADATHRVRFLIQDYAADIDTAPIEAEVAQWDAALAATRKGQT